MKAYGTLNRLLLIERNLHDYDRCVIEGMVEDCVPYCERSALNMKNLRDGFYWLTNVKRTVSFGKS